MTDNLKLIELADKAKEKAYAPYSKFKVGAAVLTENDKIYTGCNIENVSYGASVCAERTAIFKAVSEGESKLLKIAIMSSSGDFTFPCGICRQVLTEFMKDGEIVLSNNKKEVKIFKLSELIPNSFIL